MAKNHWQVINNKSDKTVDQGGYESLSQDQVDPRVLKIALKVARHIGNGLYGVDLKQKGQDIYMIEINDNPNIDHGVEDGIAGRRALFKNHAIFLR
jgi:glutathione synthase/RimK-type ligase-like ATP-grasp enzyme